MAVGQEEEEESQSTASVVTYGNTFSSDCAAGEYFSCSKSSGREVESVGPPSPQRFMSSVRLKVTLPVLSVSVGRM